MIRRYGPAIMQSAVSDKQIYGHPKDPTNHRKRRARWKISLKLATLPKWRSAVYPTYECIALTQDHRFDPMKHEGRENRY